MGLKTNPNNGQHLLSFIEGIYPAGRGTEKREFAPLEKVKDNYPKYLLSTESFTQNREGIIHKNVFDWLLDNQERTHNNVYTK